MRRYEADQEQNCQKQAATRDTYRVATKRELLPGELLNGLEH